MAFKNNIIKMSLLIIPFVWLGCAALQSDVKEVSGAEDHKHYLSKSRSFGDEHYHAVMKYAPQEGFLAIEITDTGENSIKMIRVKYAKAFLFFTGGERKEVYLKNPARKKYPAGSREAKRQLRTKPKSDVIFTKKGFLKDLSAFSLEVWLPVKGTTYLIEYEYPELSYIDTQVVGSPLGLPVFIF
jgi:hypothetical protein